MGGMTAMTEPALLPTAAGIGDDTPYGGRDPAHDMYAHAAGLLANAQALEAATADSPATVAALAPTLACLETTLVALAQATGRLRVHTLRRLADPVLGDDDLGRHRAEIAVAFERLSGVLDQGSFACTRAREAIEPVNDELTVL